MDVREIVVHHMKRHSGCVVLGLFREGISQPRKSPHSHSHREILSLNKASADVLRIWLAENSFFLAACAFRWAVPLLSFGSVGVDFHKLGIIDRIAKGIHDRS